MWRLSWMLLLLSSGPALAAVAECEAVVGPGMVETWRLEFTSDQAPIVRHRDPTLDSMDQSAEILAYNHLVAPTEHLGLLTLLVRTQFADGSWRAPIFMAIDWPTLMFGTADVPLAPSRGRFVAVHSGFECRRFD